MLKKIITAGIAAGMMLGAAVGVSAADKISFLAMHAGSSMAYISRDGVNIADYTQMVASSDAVVSPIVIDGTTYLPFRYITEILGFTDYTGQGPVKNKTFKYTGNSRGGSISFNNDGKIYDVDVNSPFEFKVDEGDIRTIDFKNIDGSLYAPMVYLARVTGSAVDWDPESGTIYFADNERTLKNFLEDDKSLKYTKTLGVMFKEYDNNLSYSDIYLKSENAMVSSISKDLNDKSENYSVNRVRKTVYYINSDSHVCSKREGVDKGGEITFYNMKNKPQEVLADNIITTKDKMYGITIKNSSDNIGYVFEADLDGENFRLLDENRRAYNLLYRTYNGREYIVYVDGNDCSTIYLRDLETGEESGFSFVDDYNSDIVNSIDIMTLGDDTVMYSDFNNHNLHCIKFDKGALYENRGSVVRAYSTEISSYNKKPLTDIVTMNYEDENKVLFFIGKSSDGAGVFYYDVENDSVGRLTNSKGSKKNIAIIKMSNSIYRIYHSDDKESIYNLMSVTSDGNIKIDNNIELKRN